MSALPPTARLADQHVERVVLCGLLKAADLVFPELDAAGLAEGDFYWHCHRLAFAGCVDLAGSGSGEVGPHSLYLLLRQRGQLAEFGATPARWLLKVWAVDPTGMDSIRAARKVKDLARRRATIRNAQEQIREALLCPTT